MDEAVARAETARCRLRDGPRLQPLRRRCLLFAPRRRARPGRNRRNQHSRGDGALGRSGGAARQQPTLGRGADAGRRAALRPRLRAVGGLPREDQARGAERRADPGQLGARRGGSSDHRPGRCTGGSAAAVGRPQGVRPCVCGRGADRRARGRRSGPGADQREPDRFGPQQLGNEDRDGRKPLRRRRPCALRRPQEFSGRIGTAAGGDESEPLRRRGSRRC